MMIGLDINTTLQNCTMGISMIIYGILLNDKESDIDSIYMKFKNEVKTESNDYNFENFYEGLLLLVCLEKIEILKSRSGKIRAI